MVIISLGKLKKKCDRLGVPYYVLSDIRPLRSNILVETKFLWGGVKRKIVEEYSYYRTSSLGVDQYLEVVNLEEYHLIEVSDGQFEELNQRAEEYLSSVRRKWC